MHQLARRHVHIPIHWRLRAACAIVGLASCLAWPVLAQTSAQSAAAPKAEQSPVALAQGEAARQVLRALPAARDFVRFPQFDSLKVSPDNEHAAFLTPSASGRRVLAVMALAKPGESRVVAEFRDADIHSLSWVNSRRLVYEAFEADSGAQVRREGAGTFAVDLDGGRQRQIITWLETTQSLGTRFRAGQGRLLTAGWYLWGSLDGEGDEVLVYRTQRVDMGDTGVRQVARLNTVSGELTTLNSNEPPFASGWLLDERGEPRLLITRRDGRQGLYLRERGQTEWKLLEDLPEASDAVVSPLYLEADGTLIVASRRGRNNWAVFTYDTRARSLSTEPLVAVDGFDLGEYLIVDPAQRSAIGLHVPADRMVPVWFDERLAKLQQAVDTALPRGRSNRLVCGTCSQAQRFVVISSDDRQPAEYFVFDAASNALSRVGEARPWQAVADQGWQSFHRVPARDGLSLPVLMTHPAGSAVADKRPAVVLVHGGPWVRGTMLGWGPESHFLASRGYRVIEVDFRGSTGLGWKHYQAGWKQWGQAMQDDLADALAWSVKNQGVDAERVCIMGTSYGGYAALMGPVTHPGLYRCAISYAGVTDLSLMFEADGTDVSQQHRRFSYPLLIGDPKADAEMLRRHSPLHRVADIKVPVLLAQGQLDRRVTRQHAETFVSAARRAGVDVEQVEYPLEAHSWFVDDNRVDFLQRVEALLERTLKAKP